MLLYVAIYYLQAFRCAYVMLIMATFWVTEAMPLAITSLIPVALLPLLGEYLIYALACGSKPG